MQQFPKKMTKFVDDMEKELYEMVKELAYKYKLYIIEVIKEQPGAWDNLTDKWVEWKTGKGMSSKAWRASDKLINSLVVKATDKGFFVGFSDKKHTSRFKRLKSNLTISQLAAVLSYGRPDIGLPARPIFPHADRRIKKDIRELSKKFRERIRTNSEF